MGGAGAIGGDPATITAGGRQLVSASKDVRTRGIGINHAGSTGGPACGGSAVGAALERFVAAYSQFTGDVSTELNALGTLANNGAADLVAATGGPRAHGAS